MHTTSTAVLSTFLSLPEDRATPSIIQYTMKFTKIQRIEFLRRDPGDPSVNESGEGRLCTASAYNTRGHPNVEHDPPVRG
jgi:hypothetical protein